MRRTRSFLQLHIQAASKTDVLSLYSSSFAYPSNDICFHVPCMFDCHGILSYIVLSYIVVSFFSEYYLIVSYLVLCYRFWLYYLAARFMFVSYRIPYLIPSCVHLLVVAHVHLYLVFVLIFSSLLYLCFLTSFDLISPYLSLSVVGGPSRKHHFSSTPSSRAWTFSTHRQGAEEAEYSCCQLASATLQVSQERHLPLHSGRNRDLGASALCG